MQYIFLSFYYSQLGLTVASTVLDTYFLCDFGFCGHFFSPLSSPGFHLWFVFRSGQDEGLFTISWRSLLFDFSLSAWIISVFLSYRMRALSSSSGAVSKAFRLTPWKICFSKPSTPFWAISWHAARAPTVTHLSSNCFCSCSSLSVGIFPSRVCASLRPLCIPDSASMWESIDSPDILIFSSYVFLFTLVIFLISLYVFITII